MGWGRGRGCNAAARKLTAPISVPLALVQRYTGRGGIRRGEVGRGGAGWDMAERGGANRFAAPWSALRFPRAAASYGIQD